MSKYGDLSKEQLVQLLEKRDRTKKLGLIWERDEIEADKAIDENFVAATLDENLSDKPSPWSNLVIEGDNFDALRWLRMTHAGKIKCIYVDPPYNTGNKDWVYNDNYVDKEDRYRFSTWLEFLYRRFLLARELLTEDGVILVSINDEHRALMELMLDEALPGMRIGTLTWRSRKGGNHEVKGFFSQNHEHILIFGKENFTFEGDLKSVEKYKNPDNDSRGPWLSDNATVSYDYKSPSAGTLFYPLHNSDTDIYYPCNPNRVWGWASRKFSKRQSVRTKFMEDLVAEKQIIFPKDGSYRIFETLQQLEDAIDQKTVPTSNGIPLVSRDLPNWQEWVGKRMGYGVPRYKRFLWDLKRRTQPLSSWLVPKNEAETADEQYDLLVEQTSDGSKAIKDIFGSKPFLYPKPVGLLREILKQCCFSGDIALDFFAGSATTAQAVMELNSEGDGNRSFIMVSSTEATEDEPDKNLCRDITAERIRLLNASEGKKYADLAAEFAYLKTREIDFEEIDYELQPSEAWNALEAIHGLPLTPYDSSAGWNEHSGELNTLVYVDQVNDAVFERIEALVQAGQQVTVYSWSPGQLRDRLSELNVELQSVRSTLVKRFQQ